MLRFGALACIASLSACTGGVCGDGTYRYGDKCVLVDPFDKTPPTITIDPPLFTREVGTVRMKSDEPATIYYTIDGSPPSLDGPNEPDQVVITNVPDDARLRYFAIDLAGNQSQELVREWIIDREGPAPPLDFRLTFADPMRTVTWTQAADFRPGGVIVARVEGQLAAAPVSGKPYAVGDSLGNGVTIVAVNTETSGLQTFSESMPAKPGLVRYMAWGYDNIYNYGAAAGDYVMIPLPPQTGTVAVDAATSSVTVTGMPTSLRLSGTASLVGSTLIVELTVRNESTRVLFAPKVLLASALPAGITLTNSNGTFATKPYRQYGSALVPGATATRIWSFAGATATTALTLDLDVRDNHVMVTTVWDGTTAGPVVDAATGTNVLQLGAPATGLRRNGMTQPGGITPDGRMIVGARNAGVVSQFDLVSGNRLLSAELRPQRSQVPQVILDRTGSTAYALVADGHPFITNGQGAGSSQTDLVRLDAAGLMEAGRLDIGKSRNRCIDITSDGKLLAVATGLVSEGVILVDLVSFTIKKRIVPETKSQVAVFAPDGESIAIVGEQVAIYTLAGERTALYPTPGTNGKVVRAKFSSPTVLWIGRRDEIVKLDISTGTSQVFSGVSGRNLTIYDDKIYSGSGNTMRRFDLTGTLETTLPGFTSMDSHWVGRSPF